VSFSPGGYFLASGGDDGTVCIWSVNTHLDLRVKIKLSGEDAVDHVQWRPTKDTFILAAAAGDDIFIIVPERLVEDTIVEESLAVVDAGFGYAATRKQETTTANGVKKAPPAVWSRPGERLEAQGVRLKITTNMTVKNLNWHRRGDFFCSVAPNGGRYAVAIHQLSKHATQIPFRKLKGIPQAAQFHPLKPHFFVATKLSVRCYDLQQGQLIKVLQPGARHISSFDIHPRGDNVIVGSYDRRLLWHDLDLSVRPYKAMRFHEKAVRTVKFHKGGLPLFADSSDDGAVQVYHGKVVSDLMENATIVPVKMLKGHMVVSQLGVLDIDWHPIQPVLATAGADGTCSLWT
jgi:ribosome biogenesis protein ERB1